jgi:hypothetical protein
MGWKNTTFAVVCGVEAASFKNNSDLADYFLGLAGRTFGATVLLFLTNRMFPFKNVSALLALVLIKWH